jgi:hypothetical protein
MQNQKVLSQMGLDGPEYSTLHVPTEMKVQEEYEEPVYTTIDVTNMVPYTYEVPQTYTESITVQVPE